jgi:hypothetical protein
MRAETGNTRLPLSFFMQHPAATAADLQPAVPSHLRQRAKTAFYVEKMIYFSDMRKFCVFAVDFNVLINGT